MRKKLKTAYQVLRRLNDNPANRDHRLMAFVRFAGWQAYKRVTRRHYDARVWGGDIRLRCYPDSSAASAVLYAHDGLADFNEMGFLRDYLRPGDHFLDVGANVGVYSLFAADRTAPDGEVIAYEPGARAHQRLCENIALNDLGARVTAHAIALSDRPGTISFTVGRDSTNQIQIEEDGTAVTPIEAARLDDLTRGDAGGRRRFAAGKMDIEGAEPLAFAGAEELVESANPPVWIIEINGRLRSFGYTEAELEAWLSERRYKLALYDARERALRRAPRAWEREPNVLAVHDEHWEHVLERLGSAKG